MHKVRAMRGGDLPSEIQSTRPVSNGGGRINTANLSVTGSMVWDGQLLQGFRDGNPEALGQVFRAYSGRLVSMVRRLAYRGIGRLCPASTLEVENTVLEIFARAFEARARAAYDGVRPYDRYLFGIARNVVLEQTRNREVAVGLYPSDNEALEMVDMEEHGPAQQAEARELTELLDQFRARLSTEEQALYQARYADGLPQEGAAKRLCLTRIQVRRREMALKRKLLGFLKERGYLTELNPVGWAFSLGGEP